MLRENSLSEKEVKDLQSNVTRLKRTVILLATVLIVLGALYVYNRWYDGSVPFTGRTNDATANPKMHNYRRGIHLNKRSMGVYYPEDSIRKYLDVHLPKLKVEQIRYQESRQGKFNYRKYKWMIGFYWMMKKDPTTAGNSNKLDFYVIPTLVDTSNNLGVIDYYADNDSVYYHGKNTEQNKNKTPGDGFAFDEGQLWP